MGHLELQVAELASLADPVRRRLYDYVVDQRRPVGRDEAGHAVGVSRALAAYHLDRLVERGLLTIRFERLGTRRGPGAGRPAKLYERSTRQFQVQLPPRRYELAARLLARAIDDAPAARDSLRQAAQLLGAELGAEAAPDVDPSERHGRLLAALRAGGYEPMIEDDAIRLCNCPFEAIVGEHRELVCGMNLALIEGLLAGAELRDFTPVLDPRPHECCVAVTAAARG